ncbi:MAG: hypothetical protein JWR26_4535 [Pedosphaera sp.]|nr:hypothetical protein [Pedosphaera sp.]
MSANPPSLGASAPRAGLCNKFQTGWQSGGVKMKKDRKKDQGFSYRGAGEGEVFGNRARAGAFRVKAGSWKNLCAAGGLTCCGQDARGPLGRRGWGRMGSGFGRLLGFTEKALKTAGGIGRLAAWTGDGVRWRERGTFVVKMTPLNPRISRLPTLVAGCRRLPPLIFRCVYFRGVCTRVFAAVRCPQLLLAFWPGPRGVIW